MEYRIAVISSISLGAILICAAYSQEREAGVRDQVARREVASMPIEQLYARYWKCNPRYRVTQSYSARADEIRLTGLVPDIVVIRIILPDCIDCKRVQKDAQDKILDGRGPPDSGLYHEPTIIYD